MSSVKEGFEYDIFISYRHNDNLDGWVSQFIAELEKQLRATVKHNLNIYFDNDPDKGLHDHHHVDMSLSGKLKTLIFIPIISQTYSDDKSFAWGKEFCAFNKLSQEDKIGREIRLLDGNVASRILPIQIHEIDESDKEKIENELGNVLRPISFVYKALGVNRPLQIHEENPRGNLSSISYLDQINKLANAIKDILDAIIRERENTTKEKTIVSPPRQNPSKRKLIYGSLAVLILMVAALIYYNLDEVSPDIPETENSIAVMPLLDLSPEKDQEYFCDGMTEEILNNLFKVEGLKIPSFSTIMRYKSTTKSVQEIATELNVNYILEGTIRKDRDQLRINMSLTDANSDAQIWRKSFDRNLKDIFKIQSEVAGEVANVLNTKINGFTIDSTALGRSINLEALEMYLKIDKADISSDSTLKALRKVIDLDPTFVNAYNSMAWIWAGRGTWWPRPFSHSEINDSVEFYVNTALHYDSANLDTRILKSILHMNRWEWFETKEEFNTITRLNPSYTTPLYVNLLLITGDYEEAYIRAKYGYALDSAAFLRILAWSSYYAEDFEQCRGLVGAMLSGSDSPYILGRLTLYLGMYDEAYKLITDHKNSSNIEPALYKSYRAIASFHLGKTLQFESITSEMKDLISDSPIGFPCYYLATVYAQSGKFDEAIHMLEKSYENEEKELFWIKSDHFLNPLKEIPEYQDLVRKVGLD